MSQVDTRPGLGSPTTRTVQLVDCDVHAQATEAMLAKYLSAPERRLLERYGRRTPRITEWYPRARNAGMRVDAWPGKPGHIWGSDRELMREQLLDEFDVDYAVLEVLSGQDCYDHPDFAAEWNSAVNEWQTEERPRCTGSVTARTSAEDDIGHLADVVAVSARHREQARLWSWGRAQIGLDPGDCAMPWA